MAMDETMSEEGRRPLLQLKSAPAAAKPEPAPAGWKCRPCGAAFTPPQVEQQAESQAELQEWVRCPACNARLGRVADFQTEPPRLAKLRARPVVQRTKPAGKPASEKLQVWRRTASGGLRRAGKDTPDA